MTMENDNQYIVLISRLDHAEALWSAWLRSHGISESDLRNLGPGDMTREIVRGERGTIAIYRLGADAFHRLLYKVPPNV